VVAVAVLVVAGLAAILVSSRSYAWSGPAAGEPYNLVAEGFRSGHVWLAKEAPAPLVGARNPYDFATYRRYLGPPWGLIDLSYYRGHLYAYFGVTPAVILFWPYRALTGAWLHQAWAVLAFCILGYFVSVGLAAAAWRRYFPGTGPWAAAAVALLLGSASTLPVFLVRPGLYEVSISCAYALTMLCLAALWNSWHRERGRALWLAAASLAYGLAVGARPSLLFGGVILLAPAAASLRNASAGPRSSPWLRQLLAAVLPVSAVGAGLAAYNFARFDDPFQFGHDYQLSGNNVYGTSSFGLRFFWENFRLYFLEPLRWHGGFPFVWEPVAPPLVRGHLPVEFFFGTLTNLPVLLAAAFVPLAWAGRRPGAGATSAPCAVVLALFLASAAPICLYAGATSRYLLDFIPALALLAALGVLALAGAPAMAGPRLTRLLRAATYGALAYSVLVAWLLAAALGGFYRGAERGIAALNAGRIAEGAAAYERVCRINPDFQGQAETAIGAALLGQGRIAEATGYLRAATRDRPGLAAAHFNLGRAYFLAGRFGQSAGSFQAAAALDPLDCEAEADLGVALFRAGRVREAVEHEQAALRIDPAFADAQANLRAFESSGKSSRTP
jgi:tetratricopeptide (TPR) repeat protein